MKLLAAPSSAGLKDAVRLEFQFENPGRKLPKGFSGKPGERLLLSDGVNAVRPRLLVGLGPREKFDWDGLRKTAALAALDLAARGLRRLIFDPASWRGPDPGSAAGTVAESVRLSQYRYRISREPSKEKQLESLAVICPNARDRKRMAEELSRIGTVAEAVDLAREISNLPGNLGSPMTIARIARKLGSGVRTKVLDRRACERLGMGAFLAVARGSAQPPAFLVLEYAPARAARRKPIVLVGKGVTFDSGGISIKPAEKMEEMKHDKSGAAAVIGIFAMARKLKPRVPLVGITPLTENLPGGNASRPGDIVRSLSGVTIEIKNTDAEGRLILADALYYAGKFATKTPPEAIIDMATLTGACSIALGDVYAALLSNNDALAKALESAGETCGERLWRLPMHDGYERLIKSVVADVQNIPEGRLAGTVIGGMFLKKFLADDKIPWAHIDIAATAWDAKGRDGRPAGATGIGVRLFYEFLKARGEV